MHWTRRILWPVVLCEEDTFSLYTLPAPEVGAARTLCSLTSSSIITMIRVELSDHFDSARLLWQASNINQTRHMFIRSLVFVVVGGVRRRPMLLCVSLNKTEQWRYARYIKKTTPKKKSELDVDTEHCKSSKGLGPCLHSSFGSLGSRPVNPCCYQLMYGALLVRSFVRLFARSLVPFQLV